MAWDNNKTISIIQKALKRKVAFDGASYSKLLILISENIDVAFAMSGSVQEVDKDADLFYEFSKKINVLDIKKALSFRFKPEQIARLGNTHIIYPSLNKDSYYKIIKNKVQSICEMIRSKHEVEIKVEDSIYDVIYKNGVFPTQGVRPVLSTISSIFENSLPVFIYNCLIVGTNVFCIKFENNCFVFEIGEEKICIFIFFAYLYL